MHNELNQLKKEKNININHLSVYGSINVVQWVCCFTLTKHKTYVNPGRCLLACAHLLALHLHFGFCQSKAMLPMELNFKVLTLPCWYSLGAPDFGARPIPSTTMLPMTLIKFLHISQMILSSMHQAVCTAKGFLIGN